eukprot:TRINITY_DN8871_c0_g1_i1.p1 TRINITY_DN8871_c0_g1~~TRINITY_DN8871_c0_g1_i1.p1  ORF type:complete len:486 (+),score=148.05 TRINITY_DN8871_c0_g1_i1:112-1569(+)
MGAGSSASPDPQPATKQPRSKRSAGARPESGNIVRTPSKRSNESANTPQSAAKQRGPAADARPASAAKAVRPLPGAPFAGGGRPVLPALKTVRSMPPERPVAAAGAAFIDVNGTRSLAQVRRERNELLANQPKLPLADGARTLLTEANETLQAEVVRLRQLLTARGLGIGAPVAGVDALLQPGSHDSSSEDNSQESYVSASHDATSIRAEVGELFAARTRDLLGRRWDDATAIERVGSLLQSVPGPELRLISWHTIKQLGRLPPYDECVRKHYTMSYADFWQQYGGREFDIVYFSHVWFATDEGVQADDAQHSKAAALIRLGSDANVFWIDYCCLDLHGGAPLAAREMLPLYIACCQVMFCYVTPGYREDAWTRLDRALFATICAPDQNCFYALGEEKTRLKWATLDDPRRGSVRDQADVEQVGYLTELCVKLWPQSYSLGFDGLHEYATMPEICPALDFGRSQVMIEEPDDADDDLEEASALFF